MHISIKCGKNKRKETYKNEDMGISYVAFSCKTDKTAHRHEKEKRFFICARKKEVFYVWNDRICYIGNLNEPSGRF